MEEGKGLFNGDGNISIVPKKIDYSDVDLSNFTCRAVLYDDKQTGEYHIKPALRIDKDRLINRLRTIDTTEVGLIDPTGTLNLEYPIYLKVGGILAKESIFDSLTEIDKNINQ